MESHAAARRERRRRAAGRRVLGGLAICSALAVAATAAIALPAVTRTNAAFTDNAYLNLGSAAGTPIGTASYDLMFRYRELGDWSVGAEPGMTAWMQADDPAGVTVIGQVNCRTALRPQVDATGPDTCTAEIHVANQSPGVASSLQVRVDAIPGSDATAASGMRYALYSVFPSSNNASARRLEASTRSFGDVVTVVGSDVSRPVLAAGPNSIGSPVVGGRLDFVFYLTDRGAATNAAVVVGKFENLQITLTGRSVASP